MSIIVSTEDQDKGSLGVSIMNASQPPNYFASFLHAENILDNSPAYFSYSTPYYMQNPDTIRY